MCQILVKQPRSDEACTSACTCHQVVFWNASVGSNFSQLDPHCTLKEVFYVVSSNNVWGNMQEAAGVRSTIFDFDNRKNWKPLFTPKWEETNEGKFQKDSVQVLGTLHLPLSLPLSLSCASASVDCRLV